jgi:hypothetical protein
LVSCATAPSVPALSPAPAKGQVSYRLLEDPAGRPSTQDAAGPPQELVPPIANTQNAPPAFPEEALTSHCAAAWVNLRLIIDGQGNVGEVGDSPFRQSEASACVTLFRAAAEGAVRGWRFSPAYRQTLLKPASDGPFGQPEWGNEAIPWYADFAFKFEVIDGKGVVTSPR